MMRRARGGHLNGKTVSERARLRKERPLSLQSSRRSERNVVAKGPAEQPAALTPLGRRENRFWPADHAGYVAKSRRGGAYEVFIPDHIAGRDFLLDGPAVAAVVEAEEALARLNATPPRVATLGALARNLLRSESAASSRIEGVLISHKRLARAAYQQDREGRRDPRAAEVLGNVDAMERDKQNWIGGNDYNPIGARYVPPPHELVPELLDDLCAFIGRDDLAPVAQAAIAHAQFENITHSRTG